MSDFPPTTNLSPANPSTPGSNTAKNRKKKNKKKAKKQGVLGDSAIPSEISSPALTDTENSTQDEFSNTDNVPTSSQAPTSVPETNALGQDVSVLPAVPKKASLTGEEDKLIQQESATAAALPAAPIDVSLDKVPAGGPVGIGAAGATAASAAALTSKLSSEKSGGGALLTEPLPLSDNVKHCIKSVVGSGSIDILSIVKKIVKNVEAGDYKARAALPPKAAAPAVPEKNTPVKAVPPKDSIAPSATRPTHDSKSDTVKKVVGGAGAAVAGAGAAVAAKVKGTKGGSEKGGDKSSIVTDKPKLSENVQHCIQSAVRGPSINLYGIIKKASTSNGNNDIKRPEPAVGGSTQPVMPSSTKAADTVNANNNRPKIDTPVTTNNMNEQPLPPTNNVNEQPLPTNNVNEQPLPPPKKSKENRKSGIASLKKKNCIIL